MVCALLACAMTAAWADTPATPQAKMPFNACGAWCLTTVLRVLGKDCTIEDVYRLSGQPEGRKLTLLDLQRAAAAKGVTLKGYHRSIEELKQARLPAILAVRTAPGSGPENHYIVLAACSQSSVNIVDPSSRTRQTINLDALRQIWLGKLLEPQPCEVPEAPHVHFAAFSGVLAGVGLFLWFFRLRHRNKHAAIQKEPICGEGHTEYSTDRRHS